jgi:hypothetical protein
MVSTHLKKCPFVPDRECSFEETCSSCLPFIEWDRLKKRSCFSQLHATDISGQNPKVLPSLDEFRYLCCPEFLGTDRTHQAFIEGAESMLKFIRYQSQ